MGLDCSHDAWHGPYGSFMAWRREIASAAGLPPLDLMEGFYSPLVNRRPAFGIPTLYYGPEDEIAGHTLIMLDKTLPIKWDCLKPSALHELLYHSDCEGEIPHENCAAIAGALEELLPMLVEPHKNNTEQFVKGLRSAAEAKENLQFH